MNGGQTATFTAPVYMGCDVMTIRFTWLHNVKAIIEPGENEIWVDMARFSRSISKNLRSEEPFVFSSSRYAPLSVMLNRMNYVPYGRRPQKKFGATNHLTLLETDALLPTELMSSIADHYYSYCDSLRKNRKLSDFERKAYKTSALTQCLAEIQLIANSYANKWVYEEVARGTYEQTAYERIPVKYKADMIAVTPEEIMSGIDRLDYDFNAPSIQIFGSPYIYIFNDAMFKKMSADSTTTTMKMYNTLVLLRLREIGDKDELQKGIQYMHGNYIPEALVYADTLAERRRIANLGKSGFTIHDISEVPADSVLSAITAEYKGQVVVADVWATWCGGCLEALRSSEQKKPALAAKGIKFIYLCISSPEKKWQEVIPDFKGEHYLLTNAQAEVLCKQFGIESIPSYIIIGKDGKAELRNELRDFGKAATLLDEELNK